MILIIAHARLKGGLSGSDNIYLHFAKYWGDVEIWEAPDFRPFIMCYIWRIIYGCVRAIRCRKKYEFVYSASDFWMDSIPAWIMKCKGNKWVAGFYLFAPRDTFFYYWTQKMIICLINRFADIICVTNSSMFKFNRTMIPVYGGIDLDDAYPDEKVEKIYDAVFVGRLHYTKGIRELMRIWIEVIKIKPSAQLAVIGAGDGEEKAFRKWAAQHRNNVQWYGYMGKERFDIYRKSKMVLYTTPKQYDHFSMGPVEAMACGCPMIAFNLDVMKAAECCTGLKGCALCENEKCFVVAIVEFMLGRWKEKSKEAIAYAKTWEWSNHTKIVLQAIRGTLS